MRVMVIRDLATSMAVVGLGVVVDEVSIGENQICLGENQIRLPIWLESVTTSIFVINVF